MVPLLRLMVAWFRAHPRLFQRANLQCTRRQHSSSVPLLRANMLLHDRVKAWLGQIPFALHRQHRRASQRGFSQLHSKRPVASLLLLPHRVWVAVCSSRRCPKQLCSRNRCNSPYRGAGRCRQTRNPSPRSGTPNLVSGHSSTWHVHSRRSLRRTTTPLVEASYRIWEAGPPVALRWRCSSSNSS
jgi:hypothetical protein